MRLIDADEVVRFYNEQFPNLDRGVHWSRNDIIMNLDNIPTVKAIPIEWIKKHIEASKHLTRQMTEYEFLQILLDDWYTYNKEKSL